MSWMIECMERGLLPDAIIRYGIRRLLRKRLEEIIAPGSDAQEAAFIQSLHEGPIAVQTIKANEQHYEVPAAFFLEVLGPRMKYSSCIWPDGTRSLAQAEEEMLSLTCKRAEIRNGMEILELGCGWGSLALWMAERYPDARITAVSNSSSQREFIEQRAAERELKNICVLTADMNDFSTNQHFDRVVSVEMFEHMRNYENLLRRISGWLQPDGKLFVHIFCHRDHTYPFETDGAENWMGRYFFTGGLMPSEHVLREFDGNLRVENQWRINGKDYARTLRAWLELMDERSGRVRPILDAAYGPAEGPRWFQRWRVFFMSCEELFAYRDGNEWFVTHLLFSPTNNH